MKKKGCLEIVIWLLVLLLALPPGGFAQDTGSSPPAFRQEELDQMLAPIALYPDELLVQVLMASTYPLEIVEADRFAKANPNLKGDQLTKTLEAKNWDPSVKSVVNFPSVLAMLSEKLEWTQKLGDAFLSQESQVMATVQQLRDKAYTQGNLKTSSEQKVIVQEKTIVIESASPQVVYVPAYNPTVVYGAWPYPAYPPYYYHPPGYVLGAAAFTFAAGVALGAAWGYAWGGCNWRGGNVNYNVNKNINYNKNINRGRYERPTPHGSAGGQGNWQHNPEHRKGVSYRDQNVARQYGQGQRPGADNRRDYRGYGQGAGDRQAKVGDRPGSPRTRDVSQRDRQAMQQPRSSNAFDGVDRGGRDTKMASDRGSSSRKSISRPSKPHGGGGVSRPSGGGRGGGGRGRR